MPSLTEQSAKKRSARYHCAVKKIQLIGIFLWRGGLAFAAMAGLYYSAWWVLTHYFQLIPTTIKVGLAVGLAGLILFTLSFVLERISDAREEGDLGA